LIHEHFKHFHNRGTLKQTSTPFQISTSQIPSKLPPLFQFTQNFPRPAAGGGSNSNEQNIFSFNFPTSGRVICLLLLLLLMDAQHRQQRKKGAKKPTTPSTMPFVPPQTLVHFWFAVPFAQQKASGRPIRMNVPKGRMVITYKQINMTTMSTVLNPCMVLYSL
jgi:hypothetical protein